MAKARTRTPPRVNASARSTLFQIAQGAATRRPPKPKTRMLGGREVAADWH